MTRRSRRANKQETASDNPIENDLNIDEHDLDGELLDQSLLYMKWIKLKEEAMQSSKLTKLELQEEIANVRRQHIGKGLKVAELEAEVDLDDVVQELRRKLIKSEYLASQFEGFVRAVYMRHDNLKDLCANMRKMEN